MSMLIRDALVITSRTDAPLDYLDARIASIGIEEAKIKAVGSYPVVKESIGSGAEEINCREADHINYLAMPGFVDAHCHSRQMALQGYSESGWRNQQSKPQGEQEMRDLFRWFLLDAAKAGVTFVGDWPEHLDLWHPKPMDEELRAVGLRGCVRVLLPHNRGEAWPTVAEAAEKLRHTLGGLDGTLQLGVWIPEEDKKEFDGSLLALLGRLRNATLDCPLFFQMHLAESKIRKEACAHALTRLLDNGLVATPAAARTIFVHVIWLDPAELNTLIALRDGVGVITCPKFADGRVAPIKELLRGGVPVGLGSDVSAPDPFSLIGRLIAVHRSRDESLHISIGEAFNVATLQGARVFGLQRQIGSIEEGKDADIVLVKNPAAIDPELFMAHPGDEEPAAYHERIKVIERLFTRSIIRREHVERVIVRGRVVVDGGSLLSRQHEEAIEAAGKQTALTVVRRLRNGRNIVGDARP